MKGDEAAVEAVKGPDSLEERVERMVALYQTPLLKLCFAYLHDEEAARDAVQETFIKAVRHLERFRDEASEKTWLCRIAINTCKDMRKSPWWRHVDRSVTPDMLPAAAQDQKENQELVLQIMSLPRKLKEAALLCWLQGLTYEEAARALGVSHQAVGSRLNRARNKLRRALEGSEPNDP